MNLAKHVSAVAVLALMAGSTLFVWGMFASSAQAATSTDSTKEELREENEQLRDQVEELKEENAEYQRKIEEQAEFIRELEGKLEGYNEREYKEREDEEGIEEMDELQEEAHELEEEAREKAEEIKEDAEEMIEENEESAKEIKRRAQEKVKEVRKHFMDKVQQLKKRAQEQKREGRAGDTDVDDEGKGDSEKGRSGENIMKGLKKHFDRLPEAARENIRAFLEQGADKNTESLGLGERKAVIESFQQAYGKLPKTDEEMARALMIANGRFPDERSEKAEEQAKEKFMEIYDREPDMENPQDRGAIMTMAYGLRQQAHNRNLKSEQKGLAIFKDVFGHLPRNTQDWNVMQAITYSGASK